MKANESFPEMMTLKEAARYLRISDRTLHTLLKENKIPSFRVGRQHRFLRTKLAEFLHGQSMSHIG